MRNTLAAILNSKNGFRLAILVAALLILSVVPMPSGAHTQTTITITNNSSREIRHVYLSPPDNDNWGPDQLNEAVIRPGNSFELGVSCDQSQIKVISEDKDGCFLDKTVDCASNSVWTITNDDVPNCGG
jgi:hypothetical protein